MKAGENYISVMEKNLKALKQTTDQAGAEIEPEKAEETKTVQNGYFEDADVKDRTLSGLCWQLAVGLSFPWGRYSWSSIWLQG